MRVLFSKAILAINWRRLKAPNSGGNLLNQLFINALSALIFTLPGVKLFFREENAQNKLALENKVSCSQGGFTLIEVIVALVIFSFLSVLGYQGLVSIIDYNERSRSSYEEQNQLHKTGAILMQDLLHLRPRPIRDRLGGRERAYTTGDPDYEVQFTRGGLPSIFGSSAGGLQRVAYSVSEDKELIRWTWPILDAFGSEEPSAQVLMGTVSRLKFYQLNSRNEFEENWPPLNQNIPIDGLPRMIRVEIELENGDKIERLIPGLQSLPQQSSNNQNGSENNNEPQEGVNR